MRISLVGCGRWGRNILRDLIALEADVAVADPDSDARNHARSAGAAGIAGSLDDLPASDGIVIATPTTTHFAVIERALMRQVPVFVEKPLTADVSHARALAERANGRLFVMDKWRYHPGIEELRRIRQSGELGAPFGMHLLHVGWGLQHHDVDASWILLPHSLSIVLDILGSVPPPIHAFAERLDGKIVTLIATLGSQPWITVEISARSPVKRREFRLHCRDGVAWLDDGWADHIQIARGSGTGADASGIEKRTVPAELPLRRELAAFLQHLKGGPAPRSSVEEGALIVERIQQLRDLAGSG
jgi:predicted dehydrogenase